jgi:hypothetical protein
MSEGKKIGKTSHLHLMRGESIDMNPELFECVCSDMAQSNQCMRIIT